MKLHDHNFDGKRVTCKTQKLYVLIAFSLIVIALIDFSIYRHLIKELSKTKTLVTISRHK